MNQPARHFTRYMDHDWGDGSLGRDERVLYTCDEDGPAGPLYDEHFRIVGPPPDAEPEALPPATGPLAVTYRRGGEGLSYSYAIISRGGTVVAEEPISADLCDALLQSDNFTQAAITVLQEEIVRTGWCIDPASGLGFVLSNLLRATGRSPWQ